MGKKGVGLHLKCTRESIVCGRAGIESVMDPSLVGSPAQRPALPDKNNRLSFTFRKHHSHQSKRQQKY